VTDVLTPPAPPTTDGGPVTLLLSDDSRRRLLALCGCASRDTDRPALTVVALEPGVAVATDSYVLGHLPLADLADVPAGGVLLPARPLAAALKGAGRDGAVLKVHDTYTTVVRTTTVAGVQVTVRTDLAHVTDVRFPDWRQLPAIAADRAAVAGAAPVVDPAKLARVAALAAGGPVRVRVRDLAAPVRVEDPDGVLLGLVMPIRWSS